MLVSTLSKRSVSFNIIFLVTYGVNKISTVVQLLGRGVPVAAGALGVSVLVSLWTIIDGHKTSYRQHVDTLKMELHGLQTLENAITRKAKLREN